MNSNSNQKPALSVAVVGICGPDHLLRCLDALVLQRNAPVFEIVVAYDPSLHGMTAVAHRYPDVRMSANQGQRTPLELASRALQISRGDVVLLTEDHCIPDDDWVRKLYDALEDGYAAAGGVVRIEDRATATSWAFYFVDFFRYAPPVDDGPSPTLTVCNVAYRRSDLEQIDPSWKDFFHETAVNEEMRERFGPLKLDAGARVTMRRHVRFKDAVRERYAFGRLFGCTRITRATCTRRILYTLGAPVLPVLLLGRMVHKAISEASLRRQLRRSILHLAILTLAWSWGEWLGYLTRRLPEDLAVAPDMAEQKDPNAGSQGAAE